MRVLWFTNTSSCYKNINRGGYNGGGWISSLELELSVLPDIELSVAFYSNEVLDVKKHIGERGTIYYLIPRPRKSFYYTWITLMGRLKTSSIMQEDMSVSNLLEIVHDFKPDIIQVFGSENIYGLIAKYVDVPVVLHIQGILNPYLNAFLPPFMSWFDYIMQSRALRAKFRMLSEKIAWQRNSITERRMFTSIKYFIGRTEWDKRISRLMSPHSKYYYCSEILRDTFYLNDIPRNLPTKPKFVTTISSQFYKGFDMVLKTAQILKDIVGVEFEWKIFGDVNPNMIEKITGISHSNVNVCLCGVASAEKIKQALLSSTAYIHTSYIDNSPNSLCEASLLGVTSVSTNVGGVSSLIENGKNGFLVPANDPYQMAYIMDLLINNPTLNMKVGNKAKEIAIVRHDRVSIVNNLLEIYNDILNLQANE